MTIITTDKSRGNVDQDPSPGRLVVTLALAGLISGLAIVGVFEVTFATITENKARELRLAVFKVLPGVTRMQALTYRENQLVTPDEGTDGEAVIYAGYDQQEKFLGFAIPGEGPGFQDTIKLLYGYDPKNRKVVGMEVLESRETPGLGDKIYKDDDFVSAFTDLTIDPLIELVKKGRKVDANQVDAITGATISSRAVVRIINETNARWVADLPLQVNAPRIKAEIDEAGHEG